MTDRGGRHSWAETWAGRLFMEQEADMIDRDMALWKLFPPTTGRRIVVSTVSTPWPAFHQSEGDSLVDNGEMTWHLGHMLGGDE